MAVMFFHHLLFFVSLFPSLPFSSTPSPLIISGNFSSPSYCSSHKHPGENGTGRGDPSTGKTAYQPWLLLHPLCNNHKCPRIWVSLFPDLLSNCSYCAPCDLQSRTWSRWKMSVEQEVLFFVLQRRWRVPISLLCLLGAQQDVHGGFPSLLALWLCNIVLILSYMLSQISVYIKNNTPSKENPVNAFSDVYKTPYLMQ